MTDYHGLEWAEKLLAMADAANVPSSNPDPHWYSDIEFELADGWKMWIFYDVGELDYIDRFMTSSGVIIDFWEWPDLSGNWEDEDKAMLMYWRGTRQ